MKSRCLGSTPMYFVVLLILVFPSVTWAQTQGGNTYDCSSAHRQFKKLNRPLLILKDEDIYMSEKDIKASTAMLGTFIAREVVGKLNEGADDNELKYFLSCVQTDKEDKPWPDLSNTPYALMAKPVDVPIAVTGVLVMRGGQTIPATAPLLQCYAKQNDRWSFVGEAGDDFNGQTFYVYPLQSPIDDQVWFLLTGKTIGGTGGVLNLEVATCDGKQMKVKWKKGGFRGGHVDVDSGIVVVTYNKIGDDFAIIRDKDGYGVDFTEILHVTPKGLE